MLDVLVSGLANGAVYALVAIGFSLVYRTTGVLNFAQGSFVMIGGLGTYWASSSLGLPYGLAIAVALALSCVTGAVLWYAVVAPLRSANVAGYVPILATLVASVLLTLAAQYILGSQPQTLPALLSDAEVRLLGVRMNIQYLLVIGVCAVLAVLFGLLLTRSSLGRQMRACAADAPTAALLGVSPMRVGLWAFMLTGLIGGVGGVLIAQAQFTSYDAGITYGIYGFIAAMVGGLRSLVGALLGGPIVGLAYALIAAYLSSTYASPSVFLLLLAVLWLRPHGLIAPARGRE